MKRFLLVLSFLFFAITINAQSSQNNFKKQDLKVYVNKKAKIIVNDKIVTLTDFEVTLKSLKKNKGMIHFAQPTKTKKSVLKVNDKVLKLISKYKVIIQAYTDTTFSKAIIW